MLESTISKNVFLGDGTATAFPFNFRVWKTSELQVVLTSPSGETSTATGWTAELTESGGTLTYLHNGAPLPEGWKLAIVRDMPFVQEVDLITGTRFDPEVIETALDVATAERQQLLERLGRAVVVEPTDEAGPEALLADIKDARTSAAASATSAQANANAAADSARSAAGSAAVATEQREAACICAGEAQAARDAAIAQTEAANTLMEAELAKVNAIVAANKTDQQAAVTAARQWAEKAPDTPVDYDEDGNPRYSARHWAENAQKIAIEPPTAERRGAIRVGTGLELTTGENGETDVLGVCPGLGGRLVLNSEEWITESGTWFAPVTGWYDLWLIGGGDGGYTEGSVQAWGVARGGFSGRYKWVLLHLQAGEEIPVVIGAGGIGNHDSKAGISGSDTSFNEISTLDSPTRFAPVFNTSFSTASSGSGTHSAGAGFGGGYATYAIGHGQFYGAGGSAYWNFYQNKVTHYPGNGMHGAIRVRWHDPAKAGGPLLAPALLKARRMASRAAAAPVTVTLYDPETGQGSVWNEADAPAKLAGGMMSEEAWLAICTARAAAERAAWLADPASVAERFVLLRRARDAKLSATDYLAAADYPLTAEERAAVPAYRQALRDLPEQEGAPWDGGGDATPWPVEPGSQGTTGAGDAVEGESPCA